MCLTVVYGAYDLLGSRKSRSTAPASQANHVGELKKFVAEVSQKLKRGKLTADYQHMITQADEQWTKDPFLLSVAPLKKNLSERAALDKTLTPERRPEIIYTGYMQIGDTRLAILNGIEYERGESLMMSEYYVKEIRPTRVVIGKVNSRETIQLPIVEIDSGIGQ